MSVASFIPSIWEARLLEKFHERSIVGEITVAPTKIEGDKIIFNNVSDVNVKDYAGTVAWDKLTTSSIELPMDIKKYFAFMVDDVDAVQAAGELVDPHVQEAASVMQENMDKAVLAKGMTKATAVTKAENAYDTIIAMNLALNKNKVPKSDRRFVINAEVLADLNVDARFTTNYTILENGVIEGASINGCTLVFSEELNGGKKAMLGLHKSAIGFGTQLKETEAMRLQDSFADGVRGLQVAGTEVLRPKALVKCLFA